MASKRLDFIEKGYVAKLTMKFNNFSPEQTVNKELTDGTFDAYVEIKSKTDPLAKENKNEQNDKELLQNKSTLAAYLPTDPKDKKDTHERISTESNIAAFYQNSKKYQNSKRFMATGSQKTNEPPLIEGHDKKDSNEKHCAAKFIPQLHCQTFEKNDEKESKTSNVPLMEQDVLTTNDSVAKSTSESKNILFDVETNPNNKGCSSKLSTKPCDISLGKTDTKGSEKREFLAKMPTKSYNFSKAKGIRKCHSPSV